MPFGGTLACLFSTASLNSRICMATLWLRLPFDAHSTLPSPPTGLYLMDGGQRHTVSYRQLANTKPFCLHRESVALVSHVNHQYSTYSIPTHGKSLKHIAHWCKALLKSFHNKIKMLCTWKTLNKYTKRTIRAMENCRLLYRLPEPDGCWVLLVQSATATCTSLWCPRHAPVPSRLLITLHTLEGRGREVNICIIKGTINTWLDDYVADVNTATHTDSCGCKHGAVWVCTWRAFGMEPRCASPLHQ